MIRNSTSAWAEKSFVLLITALGITLRLWRLESIPPGIWVDEALKGNTAAHLIEDGSFRLLYSFNLGGEIEGLFIWLISLAFRAFGISIFSLRFFPAIIGGFTITGIYLLTKEGAFLHPDEKENAHYIGLLAAFFLAFSFWHINASRVAFRAIMVPFLLCFSMYFLLKGLRTEKFHAIFVSGLIFGLGLHTYISFRIAPLILPLPLSFYWLYYIKQGKKQKYLYLMLVFILSAFLTAAPMLIYYLYNPDHFWGRISELGNQFGTAHYFSSLPRSVAAHLGMFNFRGDPNWRHNIPGEAMLSRPLGILFVTGFTVGLYHLRQWIKAGNYRLTAVYTLILGWFFVMLLPGMLQINQIPHSVGVLGVLPVVYIISAAGVFLIFKFLNEKLSRKKILISTFVILFFSIAAREVDKYFFKWAPKPEVKKAFTMDFVNIGHYVNSFDEADRKYVYVAEPSFNADFAALIAQPTLFIERTQFQQPRAKYILKNDLNMIEIEPDKRTVIIPIVGFIYFAPGYQLYYDGDYLVRSLQRHFPKSSIAESNDIKAFILND